jgi:hypothetical protein
MGLPYQYDFHPYLANLCTPPLLFRRRPPQSNYPPDTVLDFSSSEIQNKHRVVFHWRTEVLPPTLHNTSPESMPSCSKAPRGLSVLLQVTGIFTGSVISPSPSLRQFSSRYAVRAGRNLPDKEFRYHRTVIVTAAVHSGLDSNLING